MIKLGVGLVLAIDKHGCLFICVLAIPVKDDVNSVPFIIFLSPYEIIFVGIELEVIVEPKSEKEGSLTSNNFFLLPTIYVNVPLCILLVDMK